MRRRRAKTIRNTAELVHVLLDRNVYSYIAAELAKDPAVEEGGKYVGYLLSASDPRLAGLSLDPSAPALVVTDFLPSGPNATRTAVELLPDGEYQEELFRRLEHVDPAVEHVGTWHSHHCNSLHTLSARDVDGYVRTVNRVEYRPDFFLASLVTRLPRGVDDRDWIEHFLFVRGKDGYHGISDSIRVVDWPTAFGALTGHLPGGAAVQAPPTHPEDHSRNLQYESSVAWYETTEGREVLAEDKRFFAERFKGNVVAARRGQRITMTGHLGQMMISITYPSGSGASQVVVLVRADDSVILEINCNLRWRRLAVNAALAAAEAF